MEQQSNHIYLQSSLASVRLWCAFDQPQQTVHICWAKTISLSQTDMFDLSSSNFNVQGDTLNQLGMLLLEL
jgi:hypothetical protein